MTWLAVVAVFALYCIAVVMVLLLFTVTAACEHLADQARFMALIHQRLNGRVDGPEDLG